MEKITEKVAEGIRHRRREHEHSMEEIAEGDRDGIWDNTEADERKEQG